MKKLILAGTALAALVALPALAQPGGEDRPVAPRTRAQIEAAVQARFARADTNRDGFITREEVRARVEARRPDREGRLGERRAQMFDRLDSNHDGSLSRAEFDARPAFRGGQRGGRLAHRGGGMRGRLGGHGFAAMDEDRDGRISLAEARGQALGWFDGVDTDRDGAISQEERVAAREAWRERRQQQRPGE